MGDDAGRSFTEADSESSGLRLRAGSMISASRSRLVAALHGMVPVAYHQYAGG